MFKPYPDETEKLMHRLYHSLPERSRRQYAGVEALKLGHGGVQYIAKVFGCSRDPILRGIKELNEDNKFPSNRERKAGGGRKSVFEKQPAIDDAFLLILKEHTAGEPTNEKIKWTDLTRVEIAAFLAEKGFKVSRNIVVKLLKKHGFVKRKALKKINRNPSGSERPI